MSNSIEYYREEYQKLLSDVLSLQERLALVEQHVLPEIPKEDQALISEQKREAWSNEEHQKFVSAVQKYGRERAKEIALEIGTRTSVEIHSHTEKYFLKLDAIKQKAIEQSSFYNRELQAYNTFDYSDIFSYKNSILVRRGAIASVLRDNSERLSVPFALFRQSLRELRANYDLSQQITNISQFNVIFDNFAIENEDQIKIKFDFTTDNCSQEVENIKNEKIYYYNPTEILQLYELVVIAELGRKLLKIQELYEIYLIFSELVNQLQDSTEQDIFTISEAYNLDNKYIATIIASEFVFNAYKE